MDNLRVALKSLSRRVGRLKRDTRLLRLLDQLQRYAFELNTERNALQAHLAQLNSLIETSALITSSLELSEVLAGVLDAVASLTGAEYCLILLRHPESGDLELKAAWDSHGYTPERPTYSSSMVWQAINTRQPVLTRNAIIDERFQDKSSVQVNVLRSVIVMPLVINDRVIGALYADNREKEAIFSEESFRIFKAFANQAAIAISNARDYEQVRGYLQQTQQELLNLTIEIDEESVEAKVQQITSSPLFSKLQDLSKKSKCFPPES